MKLDKIKKYLGNFGGISPPQEHVNRSTTLSRAHTATEESEVEYELRTRTAAIFVWRPQ